jgi:hypothetical protein
LVRQRWWLRLVLLADFVALLVLVLHPARPLWPAQSPLGSLRESHPNSRLLVRAHTVYSVYAARHDPLVELRRLLPPQAGVVGAVLSSDDPETSLWRPFGSRRIVQVLATDTPESVRLRGLEYVVVSPRLPDVTGLTLAEWMTKYQAVLVGQVELRVYASQDRPQPWSVVRLSAK